MKNIRMTEPTQAEIDQATAIILHNLADAMKAVRCHFDLNTCEAADLLGLPRHRLKDFELARGGMQLKSFVQIIFVYACLLTENETECIPFFEQLYTILVRNKYEYH